MTCGDGVCNSACPARLLGQVLVVQAVEPTIMNHIPQPLLPGPSCVPPARCHRRYPNLVGGETAYQSSSMRAPTVRPVRRRRRVACSGPSPRPLFVRPVRSEPSKLPPKSTSTTQHRTDTPLQTWRVRAGGALPCPIHPLAF